MHEIVALWGTTMDTVFFYEGHDTDLTLSACDWHEGDGDIITSALIFKKMRKKLKKKDVYVYDLFNSISHHIFNQICITVIITVAVSTYSARYIFIWITWPAVWKLIIFAVHCAASFVYSVQH